MTLLTRWTPYNDRLALRAPLRDVSRFMDDLVRTTLSDASPAGYPPADVSETGDAYTVTVEIPGLRKEDIQLSVHENMLTLRLNKPQLQPEDKSRTYSHVERFYGTFERQFGFASSIDADGVKATYKDGVLEIVLPKAANARKRSIEVEVK